jgi:lipopolysaccharide transport system ATP-binding protein
MNDVAIQIRGLGKRYRLGGARKGYKTLRESIVAAALAPFRHFSAASKAENGEGVFWALKDVNFDVGQGEVIGVIGRNGAGKSTLLKVLSRITDPTEGEIDINGRVGSLLEVGTGFHPELTGRENVYLNGAILGMRRAEITRRFDEIVEFAEVERFLDTPVKYYSSGMYMRLAFAVAAHLEPEILVVDEVLAVGDMQFQKKCMGKMESVAAAGRTVLFVSHNIGAIRTLCQRVVWLESGRLKMAGIPMRSRFSTSLREPVPTALSIPRSTSEATAKYASSRPVFPTRRA